jgi:hypothetical protein
MAEFVLVAERNKKPVGFFTCRLNQDLLKYIDIRCLGRGLAAVSPEARGSYIDLMKATLYRGMKIMKVDIGEFETQGNNYPVIRAYQKSGMDLVRMKYIFNKNINTI